MESLQSWYTCAGWYIGTHGLLWNTKVHHALSLFNGKGSCYCRTSGDNDGLTGRENSDGKFSLSLEFAWTLYGSCFLICGISIVRLLSFLFLDDFERKRENLCCDQIWCTSIFSLVSCLTGQLSHRSAVSPVGCLTGRLSHQASVSPGGCLTSFFLHRCKSCGNTLFISIQRTVHTVPPPLPLTWCGKSLLTRLYQSTASSATWLWDQTPVLIDTSAAVWSLVVSHTRVRYVSTRTITEPAWDVTWDVTQ